MRSSRASSNPELVIFNWPLLPPPIVVTIRPWRLLIYAAPVCAGDGGAGPGRGRAPAPEQPHASSLVRGLAERLLLRALMVVAVAISGRGLRRALDRRGRT